MNPKHSADVMTVYDIWGLNLDKPIIWNFHRIFCYLLIAVESKKWPNLKLSYLRCFSHGFSLYNAQGRVKKRKRNGTFERKKPQSFVFDFSRSFISNKASKPAKQKSRLRDLFIEPSRPCTMKTSETSQFEIDSFFAFKRHQ